jgi:pyruvate ferredoxin oxidoreductase gamma subunit
MLAAIVKVSGVMEEDAFLQEMESSLKHKFSKKPEVLDGNMKALKMAFSEVR